MGIAEELHGHADLLELRRKQPAVAQMIPWRIVGHIIDTAEVRQQIESKFAG